MDTNIVSLMGLTRPPPGLRSWLLRVGITRLAICYPIITELLRGAHLLEKDNPRKCEELKTWVASVLSTDFPVLEMTPDVAMIYARMTSIPRLRHMWTVQRDQKRNRLGHDLMIAAVAIAHDVPVMTANISDFMTIQEEFPLPGLYHPMTSCWHVWPKFEVPLPSFDGDETSAHEMHLPTI